MGEAALDFLAEAFERAEPRRIVIPYRPRRHFRPLHESKKRFKATVAHRRAGKTVALVNELIKSALSNTRQFPPPRYAYVGPSFAQAKDLVWGYLKHYLHGVPGITKDSFSESELTVTLPTGAKISLFGGSAAYERMRGLYFDGIVLDEYAMLEPTAWSKVIRPTLADYKGWAIVSGTSDGDDHFHELIKRTKLDKDWDVFIIPVTDTDALHPDEVEEMRKEMAGDPGAFDREMLCSFEAPAVGAYYAELILEAKMATPSRFMRVPLDPHARIIAAWDLGISDYMSIWIAQRIGREWHIIDYIQDHGKPISHYLFEMAKRGYRNVAHLLPHDAKARELITGTSRYEYFLGMNEEVFLVPNHKPEDRIEAVRNFIPLCVFDLDNTLEGVKALKAYRSAKSDTLGFTKPLHNWASHGADAFGHLAFGYDQVVGWTGSNGQPLRRKLRGMC
jgi:phage terminase large subunit